MSSADDETLLVTERLADGADLPISPDSRSRWQAWFSAHQIVADSFDRDIQSVIEAHQLPNANGKDLELIGQGISNVLGKRRGRGEEVYRHFLSSLVSAFGGRGREKDIKFALASGVLADEDDIVLTADLTANEYHVEIRDHQGHPLSLVDELCDHADAFGVERAGPVTYRSEAGVTHVGGSDSHRGGTRTSSAAAITHVGAGESGTRIQFEDGWGGFEFDDGHHFDITEPGEFTVSAIENGETENLTRYETTTVESPFAHDGTLNHDGTVDHD